MRPGLGIVLVALCFFLLIETSNGAFTGTEPFSFTKRPGSNFLLKDFPQELADFLESAMLPLSFSVPPDIQDAEWTQEEGWFSDEEIERRRQLWIEAMRRRRELPREERLRRWRLWVEARRHQRAKRRFEYMKDRFRYDKRIHVTFGLGLSLGDPLIGTHLEGKSFSFGPGGHIGILRSWHGCPSYSGMFGLFLCGDFRFDYFTSWRSDQIIKSFQCSIGPVIGFEVFPAYIFIRPGLGYGKLYYSNNERLGYKDVWRVNDDSLGYCFGFGIGLRLSHGFCLHFLGNFFWPASRYDGYSISNPGVVLEYGRSFFFTMGISFRV